MSRRTTAGLRSQPMDQNVDQFYEEVVDGTGRWFLCKYHHCGELENTELDIIGHLKTHLPQSESGFVMVSATNLWSDMFVRHFVDAKDISHDDLLFFVRNAPKKKSRFVSRFETKIEVLRKCSPRLPTGDPEIDWEETFYLNVIMQKYEYSITCAVCTRTSPKELQILKKFSQKVFSSPSRRAMDCKGDTEQISYPNIFFTVDNYDDLLNEILVRDGEMVCVELLATDRLTATKRVIFFGSIQYQVLKQVHDARASISTRISRKTPKPYFQGQQRIEFVKMKGPGGKGIAEMAVAKQKGAACETPTSEPGFSLTDRDFDFDDELEDNEYIQRRMSDPSSNLKDYIRGWHQRREVKKAISEHEINNCFGNGLNEIEAGDVRDELGDSASDRMWSMRGFRQAYHFWKENKRASSPALHGFITYITLPWYHIVADLFSNRQQSILTFE